MVKVDTSDIRDMLDGISKDMFKAWQSTGTFFKNTTPVKSGTARSRTHTVDKRINANYDYAGRLDEGWSKQAPQGMSDPSITYFEKQIDNIVRKHG